MGRRVDGEAWWKITLPQKSLALEGKGYQAMTVWETGADDERLWADFGITNSSGD